VRRTPEQSQYLASSLAQFWNAADRIFALAASGHDADAREQIRLSLQARQAALSTAVARLLIENYESEEQTARRVQDIYVQVQRQVFIFLGATFIVIALTSLYLIRSNRQLFARLSGLSTERRELAQQLIATRESTLREISRELHDEFGQVLTAMGSMLGRAGKHAPEGSPLRAELREIGEIAQTTLDNVRGLSQTLHPSILDDAGLERTVDWYLSTIERQLGVAVSYERPAVPLPPVSGEVGIQVYRVLQESLSNVARHSGAKQATVRLRCSDGVLELEIEDRGTGLTGAPARRGLGIVAMRERAALVGGTIEFLRPAEGGLLVRMKVPVAVHG
jgi:signal transduction histidine kinase